MLLSLFMMLAAAAPAQAETPVFFDIWDWTAPAKDAALFEEWAQDLKQAGVDRIELSVPWKELEPEPGVYDLTWLEERVQAAQRAGIGLSLRINSYYGGATPDWYEGARWKDASGAFAPQEPPSITDPQFWQHYGTMCTKIAEYCDGKDVLYNPFIGIHAELKYADWWHFADTTVARWREAIAQPRPDWLLAVVARNAPLPDMPEVPAQTDGEPDLSPASRAVIAFREQMWREAVQRFIEAIHAGDPDGRIAIPLGESYRNQSALFSNLDYWGMTRGADLVVHSYDFFWHVNEPSWQAAAAVASFRGITQLPVQFEFDSFTGLLEQHGYTRPALFGIGRAAHRMGAGLKIANMSYYEQLPSQNPVVREMIDLWHSPLPHAPYDPTQHAEEETILLFVSKWANYSYREPTQWLHDAQFGAFKLFEDLGLPVRIICEDNLEEDLSGYKLLYAAFSPLDLMPAAARERLEALEIPKIIELPRTPKRWEGGTAAATGYADVTIASEGTVRGPVDLREMDGYRFALEAGDARYAAHRPGEVILGYPAALLYVQDVMPQTQMGIVVWAIQQALAEE